MKDNMIFIVGVGRSGTSLLQSMLHSHPYINFLPETQFLRNYVLTKKRINSSKFQELIGSDLKFDRFKVQWNELNNTSTPLKTYESIVKSYKSQNSVFVGEKDPRILDYMEQLKSHFPNAKVIHIIRDPRDVVLSRTKAEWSRKWPFYLHSYLYNAQLERGRRNGRSNFKKNYKELYYEELIGHPRSTLKDICDFLNISYHQEMLNFGEHAKDLVDKNEFSWKKETFGPLLNKNKDKWKKELNSYQIALIQKSCRDLIKEHPYRMEKINLSVLNRFKLHLHRLGSILFKLIYPLRIK